MPVTLLAQFTSESRQARSSTNFQERVPVGGSWCFGSTSVKRNTISNLFDPYLETISSVRGNVGFTETNPRLQGVNLSLNPKP